MELFSGQLYPLFEQLGPGPHLKPTVESKGHKIGIDIEDF